MQVFSTIWGAQEDQHLEQEIFVLVLEERQSIEKKLWVTSRSHSIVHQMLYYLGCCIKHVTNHFYWNIKLSLLKDRHGRDWTYQYLQQLGEHTWSLRMLRQWHLARENSYRQHSKGHLLTVNWEIQFQFNKSSTSTHPEEDDFLCLQ